MQLLMMADIICRSYVLSPVIIHDEPLLMWYASRTLICRCNLKVALGSRKGSLLR